MRDAWQIRQLALVATLVVGCAAADVPIVPPGTIIARDAAMPDAAIDAPIDAPIDASVASDAGAPPAQLPEVWLRGSTHVHAKPSGDSTTPIPEVVAWYETRKYDFIVLTDHNQVSEIDKTMPPTSGPAVRNPPSGLIVIAGSELTHNPSGCLPAGDKSKKCRIHVNAIGVTARPIGKLDWANRKTRDRLAKYESALAEVTRLGAIAQLNHPQWFWGMTSTLLVELAKRGVRLVEIANSQFAKWNKGDKDHPSMEAIWDGALVAGVDVFGVASDDAHDYGTRGEYLAGGGWVVVRARREPQAIVEALLAGRFYASNGVELVRVARVGNQLVIEAAPGSYTIAWIEQGKRVATTKGASATRTIPATGYLRAVVIRADGKRAWVQPVRR